MSSRKFGLNLVVVLAIAALFTGFWALINRPVTTPNWPQHVNNWFKRGVPMARLDEIAELLCVTSRWLRTGEGPKHPPTNYPLEGPNTGNNAAAREDCGHYRCGHNSGPEKIDVEIPLHASFNAQESLRLSLHTLEQLNVTAERALGAYMVGNSMIEIIQDGAILAIDRGRTQIIDGEIYALEHDGMLRIKYLYNRPGGGLRMRSHNGNEHPDELLTYDQRFEQNVQILGWVFWWSTLNNRRPPVPLDDHLIGYDSAKPDQTLEN